MSLTHFQRTTLGPGQSAVVFIIVLGNHPTEHTVVWRRTLPQHTTGISATLALDPNVRYYMEFTGSGGGLVRLDFDGHLRNLTV